jgi:plasmid stabilization system protein ParE
MNLAIQKAEFFKQDYAIRFAWYVDEAGPEVARRFQAALDQALSKLVSHPDLGRRRKFSNPRLQDLRSIQIERPFNKLLVFYRVSGDVLHAVRLLHGARDLPRRLSEPPLSDAG